MDTVQLDVAADYTKWQGNVLRSQY